MRARLPRGVRPGLLAAVVAVLAVTVAWVLGAASGLDLTLAVLPAGVAAAAWLGGTRSAAAAAVAGWVACDLLYLGEAARLGPYDAALWSNLIAYAVLSALVVALCEAGWRARAREANARGFDDAERRRAAEARASLAAIVETSDDAIISKDLDGTIRSWNPGAERLFGYRADEMVGRSIDVIIPASLRDEERDILGRIRRGERLHHFDTVRLTRNGRRLDLSVSISPIRDESGRVAGASTIARDITERKRAEAALRFSEERFRELADNIDQLAWTCDEHGHITWRNRRWYDYTGSTPEEMRTGSATRFHHPDHVDRVTSGFRRALEQARPWEDTFPLRGHNGEYRWFLCRATPIRDEAGHVVRWFGTNTDITEQRLLEQELAAADRRKDEFLATLAHELRNPLAPVRNAVEILNLAGDDAGAVDRARAVIDRQMTHMVRLVDDLLDVSRITRDRLELRPTDVELNALTEQTVESQRPLIEEKGLTLTVSRAPEPLMLEADPVRLAQILTNLMSNAARFTPRGGHIAVSVTRHGSEAELRVRDDGIGIPPEQLEAIFEMFTQANQAHQDAPSGLGIGLTLVRRLAELHRGTVRARSEGPGRGSEFMVRLPLAPARAAPQPAPAAPDVPSSDGRRVLVVEDNPDTASTLATLLELAGHTPRLAHDGTTALELAESFRPHVVLLDLGLPKMDGVEVCRRLRRQPWGRKLIIAALTGWGQETDRQRTREAGFDEHLVKPVGPEAILGLVAASAPAGGAAGR